MDHHECINMCVHLEVFSEGDWSTLPIMISHLLEQVAFIIFALLLHGPGDICGYCAATLWLWLSNTWEQGRCASAADGEIQEKRFVCGGWESSMQCDPRKHMWVDVEVDEAQVNEENIFIGLTTHAAHLEINTEIYRKQHRKQAIRNCRLYRTMELRYKTQDTKKTSRR